MYEEEKTEPEFLKRPKANPFRTPEYYFDTLEDRVMANIHYQGQAENKPAKLIRFLKPVLSLAASFALVYLLVYYPITTFLPNGNKQTVGPATDENDWTDAYSLSLTNASENALIELILAEDESPASETNQDELIAYLSSEMNDVEIYTELKN